MNNSDNNNKTPFESTVFSAPAEHNDKKGGKKKKIVIISAALAVLIGIAGILFSVIKFVPDKVEETTLQESKTAYTIDQNSIKGVTFKLSDDEFSLYPQEDSDGISWLIEGLDAEKIDLNTTDYFLSTIASLSVSDELKESDESAFGFDTPYAQISVLTDNEKDFELTVGNSEQNGKTYVKLSGANSGTYIVSNETAKILKRTKIDYASTRAYPAVKFQNDVSQYRDVGGALISFDKITASGSFFGDTIVIEKSSDPLLSDAPYVLTSPKEYYANNVDTLLTLFSQSLSVSGAYCYTKDPEVMKNLGFDDPYAVVTISVSGEEKTYKFVQTEEKSLACVSDDFDMIRKVPLTVIPFKDIKSANDFCAPIIEPYSLENISSVSVITEDEKFDFTVSNENGNVSVLFNGNPVSDFEKTFYQPFSSIAPASFENLGSINNPILSVVLGLSDGRTVNIAIDRGSGIKYNFSVNGKYFGQITSASYKKIINSAKAAAK